MKVHAVTRLVTFNRDDFKRFHGTEITVTTPPEIVQATQTSD